MTDAQKIEEIRKAVDHWKENQNRPDQVLGWIRRVVYNHASGIPERHPMWPTIHREYKIEFDGGTPCNIPRLGYGIGYGSFRVNGGEIVRCDHKIPMSANAAEIMTLIEGIRYVCRLEPNRNIIALDIWGDSQIAIKWALGFTKKENPAQLSKKSSLEFRNVVHTLRDIIKLFGYVKATWHPRIMSVKTFGH